MPTDYSLYTNEDQIPGEGIVLKKARAKSKGGTLTDNVQPGQAVLPNAIQALRERAAGAYEAGQKLFDAEPDMSQLQAYAQQQGEAGNAASLNALAAQFAGEGFQPMQAQFLKKAAAAQEPMKLAGGMLTPDGKFIKDPYAQQDKKAEFLLRQAQAYEQMATQAQSAQEKRAAEQAQNAVLNEIRLMNANTARMNANNAGANLNKAPSGYQWVTGPDGTPIQTFIPGGPADPANKGNGNPTEDERKALTWLFQADNAWRNMANVLKTNPQAANYGIAERVAGAIPGAGGDIANYIRSADRQKYKQAADSLAEALLRAATGAGVNKFEAEQKVKELTPQLGDKPDVLEQKRESIQVYLKGLQSRSGRALPGYTKPTAGGAPAPAGGGAVDPLGLR